MKTKVGRALDLGEANETPIVLGNPNNRAGDGRVVTKNFGPHSGPAFDSQPRKHLTRQYAGVSLVP
jgi:hypothetical protein